MIIFVYINILAECFGFVFFFSEDMRNYFRCIFWLLTPRVLLELFFFWLHISVGSVSELPDYVPLFKSG